MSKRLKSEAIENIFHIYTEGGGGGGNSSNFRYFFALNFKIIFLREPQFILKINYLLKTYW